MEEHGIKQTKYIFLAILVAKLLAPQVLRHFWYECEHESINNSIFPYILVNICELLSCNFASCADKTGKRQ